MKSKYVTYYDAGLNKIRIPCEICKKTMDKFIVVRDDIGRPFKNVCSEECKTKARENRIENREELKRYIEEIKKAIKVLIYYNGDSKSVEARTQELKLLESELNR